MPQTPILALPYPAPTDPADVPADLQELAEAFEPDPWITPTFENGWLDYGAGIDSCQYYKDALGTVHIKGAVKSGTLGSAAFTLPAGYRPGGQQGFSVPSMSAFGQVSVLVTGAVVPSTGNPAAFELNGIAFRAAG